MLLFSETRFQVSFYMHIVKQYAHGYRNETQIVKDVVTVFWKQFDISVLLLRQYASPYRLYINM